MLLILNGKTWESVSYDDPRVKVCKTFTIEEGGILGNSFFHLYNSSLAEKNLALKRLLRIVKMYFSAHHL